MKLTLHQGLNIPETEIIIRCSSIDPSLSRLIEQLRQFSFALEGKADGAIYHIPLEKILYIDSVDGRCFYYTEEQIYESKDSLAVLDEKLKNSSFLRISKNSIINLSYLKCVTPLWNHRMEATLKNGEKLVVNRNYMETLKDHLSRGGVL